MSESLIALSGVSLAGKDTVADVLVKEHGFVKIALADQLKRILRELLGFSSEQLWGSLKNDPDTRFKAYRYILDAAYPDETAVAERKEGLSPRDAFQKTGDAWGRGLYEHVWVDYVMKRLPAVLAGHEHYRERRGFSAEYGMACGPSEGVVLTDVRHATDFDRLWPYAWMVRVKRDGAGLVDRRLAQHASEAEQRRVPDDRFDHVFENKGPVEDVPRLVAEMLVACKSSRRPRKSVTDFQPHEGSR